MPELPDVEVLRRYLYSTALHQAVVRTSLREDLLEGASAARIQRTLKDNELTDTHRHGKWLFVKISSGPHLVLHFGMTGNLNYFQDPEDEPENTQMLLEFSNGYHLAYICTRKLGRIDLVESIDTFVQDQDLGPDALRVSRERFMELLEGRRGMIKSALMDQSLIAGFGNVWSDEMLFQTGVHPRTEVDDLSEEKLGEMFDATHRIMNALVDAGGNARDLPDWYLATHREEGAECGQCGASIQRLEISGRGCYFCPDCQAKP